MFGSLFKKQKQLDRFLTVTIDSSSVRVLAMHYDEDQDAARIVGKGKVPLEPGTVRSGEIIDRDRAADALGDAVDLATAELEYHIKDVVIGVTGTLGLGKTTTVKVTRDGEETISQKEIGDIQGNISLAAQVQAQSEYAQITGDPSENLEVVTTNPVYFKIDSEVVKTLEDANGSVLEAAVFNTFTPSAHVKNLEKIAKKSGLNIVSVGSHLYGLAQALKETSQENRDFVIVEIGSDRTTVGVAFGGGIVATKTLDVGFFHFVEGINDSMGLTLEEAQKLLVGYCAGSLRETEEDVVKTCIEEILNIWISGVEILFEEFTEVKTFAPQVYITGKGSTIPDVVNYLKEKPWTKTIPFKALPEIKKLEMADFDRINDATGTINSTSWLPVATLSTLFREMKDD
jgi:cell division ATPase FtsA